MADAEGRPIRFFLSAGQVSDYTGALALLSSLPKADWLLADKGYNADWFKEACKTRASSPASPAGAPVTNPSSTTSDATSGGTGSRTCSAA